MSLNRFNYKIAVTTVFFLFSAIVQANSLDEFYKFYKSGHYSQAIESLEQLRVEDNSLSSKAYLSALSYAKMQEYDKAAIHFAKAIELKNDSIDLYYEYGQALYAGNELKKAREAFKISAERKFNVAASLYYVAHISQILEEFDTAKDYYMLVLKDQSAEPKMKQIANFQISETLLSIARERTKEPNELNNKVEKFIVPMMQKTYEMDRSTPLANDVFQRILELKKEFNLDPDVMVNKRRISPKRFSGYAVQKIKFDDNISLTNEENNIQQSKKESYIFETEAYAKYDLVAKKKFILSPEARINFTEYSDKSNSEVYQNDSLVMSLALKNKYEHSYKDKPASLIFDFDYSRTMKDWHATKKREFYASSTTLTFGESLSYFDIGNTAFKVKRKDYAGASEMISNHTISLSADQTFFLPIQHLLIALLDASFNDNYNNSTTNTNTYLLRLDYIIPDIAPDYTLGFGLAYTLTDTLKQKDSRGTEKNFNPSIDLSRELGPKSKISINYDYSKTTSKNTSYAYKKNVFTSEYRYSF